jgi:cytochrome c biogenesis protein CcmG, thiol:disulfide interchange protein DsbE
MTRTRRRSRRSLAWLAVIAAVGLLLAVLAFAPLGPLNGSPSPDGGLVGRPAPPLTASGLDGRVHALADGRGRVTWVNFWATSCEPCRTEMPAMQRLAKAYGDRLLILGVDWGESEASVRDFVERYGVTYPILLDPTLDNFYRWSSLDGLPRHYFVDADGILARQVIGPLDPTAMVTLLADLIGPA